MQLIYISLEELTRLSLISNCCKSEKTVNTHTMHTDSLKSTARSSQPKGTDMRGIQKIKNKEEVSSR